MCCPGQPTSDDVKNMLEQAANQIATDNTELACAFIQKTATEKSVTEMDKRLAEVCCNFSLCVGEEGPVSLCNS